MLKNRPGKGWQTFPGRIIPDSDSIFISRCFLTCGD
jgi:hypothetical protein